MLFTSERSGKKFAKDPSVVKLGKRYFMYYSDLPNEKEKAEGSSLEIGIASSYDMEKWEVHGVLPKTQECEKNGIGAPGAIVIENKVHMFYQTYGNAENDAICHAVSEDGINFIKDETNPVFKPTKDWCCGRAIDADVCVFGGKLMLYAATRDHKMKIQKIAAATADLNSIFSRQDFVQLCKTSILSPELKWEEDCIEAPATVVHDGKIYMFYGGAYNCSPQQIGCAVSSDGRIFDKIFIEKPFIECGEKGTWNESESGHPYAFQDDDGRYWLFYQGINNSENVWRITKTEIAFDDNGIPYKKGYYTEGKE